MTKAKMTVENTVTEEELKEIEEARKQFYQQENISPEEESMVKDIMVRIRERKKELKSLSKNTLIKAIVHYELRLEQIQLLQSVEKEQNEDTNSNTNTESNVSNNDSSDTEQES